MSGVTDDSEKNPLVKLTSLLVVGVGLTTLFLGYSWFWMVFAVGFAVVVPAVKVLADEFGAGETPDDKATSSGRRSHTDGLASDASESKQDALDTLRTRYASGELSEAEFERKVERLLETETLEEARGNVTRATERDDRDAESRDRATER